MRTWTEQERITIVAGWSTSTDDDQATYARRHGISPRTLRAWAERYGSGPRPIARAKAIIERAIEQLRVLQLVLDAEALGADDDATKDTVPDRHREPPQGHTVAHADGDEQPVSTAAPKLDLDTVLRDVRAGVACQLMPGPERPRQQPPDNVSPTPAATEPPRRRGKGFFGDFV